MAIVLEANYAKKLGLPGYSSHQYSVSIRTELTDLSQVEAESNRLYRLLQDAVDQEIQEVGFMPEPTTYGARRANGRHSAVANAQSVSASAFRNHRQRTHPWNCTERQKSFIQNLVRDFQLDKNQVEELSLSLFRSGVRQLNRLQASGLIAELIRRFGRESDHPAPVNPSQGKTNGSSHHVLPQPADRFRGGTASEGASSLPL